MQFFIDTANIDEIKKINDWGIIDGVTTNPSLIAKMGGNQAEIITEIAKIVDGPISAEVIATDYKGMIEEGQQLAKIHKNIVIKVPMTEDGLMATKWFTENKIKTNVTLIFSANQALLAAKNGATYVSPFIGRLDDIGHTGTDIIGEIRVIFDNYGMSTQILAASIRHCDHVKHVAMQGSDVATIPYGVLTQLIKHPLTDIGLEKFLSDHNKAR
ncbi:MAG: fructose-6-phosphate aldolase [Halobacteriovoraceae bacterium]|nr:fructose-6-phosphate aldolase [Halobacteriovoraceae bacterium]